MRVVALTQDIGDGEEEEEVEKREDVHSRLSW
jgi:hypothetical protein